MNNNGINDDPVPIGNSEGTATPAVVSLEPVAFMTHHDEPMLFPTWDEAVQYCDDDESPISLFHADDVAKLQAELAAMTQELDHWREANRTSLAAGDILKEQLIASQAYAQQLREALEVCKKEMQGDKWDSLYIDGVLALPQDDTALRQQNAKLLRELVYNRLEGLCNESGMKELLRKADELEAGK